MSAPESRSPAFLGSKKFMKFDALGSRPLPQDAGMEALKAAPPAMAAALTLNEWVAVATIAYIVLQAAYLIWRWRRQACRPKPENG